MCYSTWFHICLGNEISALHILITPPFREALNICKSSGFRVYAFLFLKKMKNNEKNWANKASRQGNRDCVDVSNLILKDWDTLAHTPRCTYRCILCVGWKMRVGMRLFYWDIFWLYVLLVYTLVTSLLRCCSCMSCVHNFPIIHVYI